MSETKDTSPPRRQSRGDVQVETLMCKSCGLCAEYCPVGVMKPATEVPPDDLDGPVMNPSGHVVYLVHDPEGKCTGCGICAAACPEGAVVVYRNQPAKMGADSGEEASGE